MSAGEEYLAAAYVVVLAVVLVYLVIHSLRLARMERQIAELVERGRHG